MAQPIGQHVDVDGVSVFYLRAGPEPADLAPAVFVHGNPTNSGQWRPFIERLERPAVALDLPGWGRSAKPAGFDYGFESLGRFFGRFLDELGIERYRLCADDWGAGVGLVEAQRRPERVERLVLIDGVPLLPGYRWHWVGRLWRTPLIGELVNLTLNRPGLAYGLRQARGDRSPMPDEFVEMIWSALDRRTRRAILRLYRSASPEALAAAGARLGEVSSPALVVWGKRDPYLPLRFGRMYAERLPGAELLELEDAGHWPWLDRPELVGRVTAFLDAPAN